ncbi:MAG: GNAT family N-acetyltransferase [Bacteroidales bacterium]|nr:GNAT family N-acetyltransferase [Bacteroidales bacterium]
MSAIHVRLADDTDNDNIISLAERCPQEGMITFFINRTPRFNSLHRLLDPGAWHFVACKADRIIGLVGVTHFPARILDREYKLGYMLDLRVDEAYRSGITAFRLVKTAIDHIRESDADMVIANFLKENRRPLVFTSGRGGLPEACHLGTNRIFNIIPIRRMRLDKRFEIGIPTADDIPEITELYRKYASGFKIAPVISEQRFKNYLSTIDGLSLNNFLVAREKGKIVAVTAVWDEHTYKSYQVLKLNRSITIVTAILNGLSHIMKVPHPIRLNEPLRQLSLLLYAHDDRPEALDTLFRHVNNVNLGSEYTLIMLYAQETDPIFRFMKKYIGISVRSEMYLFAKDTSVYEELKNDSSGVMFDFSMTI